MQSLKIGQWEVQVPIIQGGMGVGVSLSGLAGAVAGRAHWRDFHGADRICGGRV